MKPVANACGGRTPLVDCLLHRARWRIGTFGDGVDQCFPLWPMLARNEYVCLDTTLGA